MVAPILELARVRHWRSLGDRVQSEGGIHAVLAGDVAGAAADGTVHRLVVVVVEEGGGSVLPEQDLVRRSSGEGRV